MAISMLKIRRPLGRLIFNMGIAIPGKTIFLIEMAPRTRSYFTVALAAVVTHKAINNIARNISENHVVNGAGSIQSNLSSGV